ncbi:MAG TPA: hypothetical protein VK968_13050 [Roseimicrobium sp.]|nr:hypothetical protein [Roseimicrobium sp.]
MNFAPYRRAAWLFGNTLLACAVVSGTEVTKNPEPIPDGEAVMPGVFNTELPKLVLPESLRITLRPHFGDFLNEDYFRVTVGARYGLTPQLELSGDADTYISHGFGDESVGKKIGVASVTLGMKYNFSDLLLPYWDTAVGLKYRFPVSGAPADLTDGLHHVTPYMTLAHDWASRPDMTTFISYGMDFVAKSDLAGSVSKGEFDANHWFITPGVLWHRGAFDYTLETDLKSTFGLSSRDEYRVTVRPGVKWTLPPPLRFYARSHWVVGVSVSGSYGTGGTDVGVSARLQTNFDFKRFFRGRPQLYEPEPAK